MIIKTYATLRDLLGASRIALPVDGAEPARAVFKRLMTQYPLLGPKLIGVDGRLTGFVTVLVNGRSIDYLDGLDTLLADEDTISLFPPVGGGA